MGHLRLGRLPKTANWQRVIALLDLDPVSADSVAAATTQAASLQLERLKRDPALAYSFWLLTQIAGAAREGDLASLLSRLGIDSSPDDSILHLVARVGDHVRAHLRTNHEDTAASAELASLSLRFALGQTIGLQGQSFFGSSLEDFQRACQRYSTRKQFGVLTKVFFGDYLSRTLRSYIDRELLNHVGQGSALRNVSESRQFRDAVDLYARQSARIIEDFAGGWFTKHEYETGRHITVDHTKSFVAVAMRKLQMELQSETVT